MVSTEAADALIPPARLQPFDGRDVLRTSIAITRAGDGLSEALRIDPREFHHGEVVHVVLECVVTKVDFRPIDPKDPDGPLVRSHTLSAGTATVVDADLVSDHLAKQRDRIQKAREEAAGIQRIPGTEPEGWGDDDVDVEALGEEHALGQHAIGLVPGCEACEAEAAAEAEENQA